MCRNTNHGGNDDANADMLKIAYIVEGKAGLRGGLRKYVLSNTATGFRIN